MVEGLDKLYENTWEFDIVYFLDKVLGGKVIKTNVNDIIDSSTNL